MEKYKRFKEELATDENIQEFLDKITIKGWEIIYYVEKEFGGMGIMQVTIIGKKKEIVL